LAPRIYSAVTGIAPRALGLMADFHASPAELWPTAHASYVMPIFNITFLMRRGDHASSMLMTTTSSLAGW